MTNKTHANTLSPADAAYIAGIVDGEGCIGVRIRGKYIHPRVEVVNTDKRLLIWLKEVTGVGTVYDGKKLPLRKMKYDWIISAQPASELLQQIIPYMRVKRLQAHLFCAIAHYRRLPVSTKQELKHIAFALAKIATDAKHQGK